MNAMCTKYVMIEERNIKLNTNIQNILLFYDFSIFHAIEQQFKGKIQNFNCTDKRKPSQQSHGSSY